MRGRPRPVVVLALSALLVGLLIAAVWQWVSRAPDGGAQRPGDGVAVPGLPALPWPPTQQEPFLPLFVDACHTVALAAEAGMLAPLVADLSVGDGVGLADCRFTGPDLEVIVTIGLTDFAARVEVLAARASVDAPPEPVRVDGTLGAFVGEEDVATLVVAGHDHDLTVVVASSELARDEARDLAVAVLRSSFSAG